jgi:hypothetical protein
MPASCSSVFARRRSSKKSASGETSTPFARRWSASQRGNVSGTDAAQRDLGADLAVREPLLAQLVEAERVVQVHLEEAERLEPLRLHRVRQDVPLAVLLGVEDRVGNTERNRVAHVRGAKGVGVDEDVGQAPDHI